MTYSKTQSFVDLPGHGTHEKSTDVQQKKAFQTVIGLEVHAQIVSKSKLFSGAPAYFFGQEANTCVSFVDGAFPGMLPVLNETCIHQAIKIGLAVKGKICLHSIFDRKHYFYPDQPAGYQISQYKQPLVEGGHIWIKDAHGQPKMIRLDRIHVEQDAGKSLHDQDPTRSYVDFNRAGVGLMEIVSQPDLSSPEEVVAYVKNLRCLLRAMGVCQGDMEKGQMRVDANVSIHYPDEPLGVRVELKNMNSVRFLQQALRYEIARQIDEVSQGGRIYQETRMYDPASGVTRIMREKEADHDYFYFPDPDLLPLVLTQALVDEIQASLPETPHDKALRFMHDFSLSEYDAELLAEDLDVACFFEETVAHLNSPLLAKLAANWMIGEVFATLNRVQKSLADSCLTPMHLANLINAIDRKELSNTLAKEVFSILFETGQDPKTIMKERGMIQISDDGQVRAWIQKILTDEQEQVEAYLSGKDKLFAYFVGQVMKLSKGKANPQSIQALLKEELHALR